jgi:hypothetical protein
LTYRIDTSRVADEVASFPDHTRRRWNSAIQVIADDPTPRFGYFQDKDVPIREWPTRTWLFDIELETSVSGEEILVFHAETLPDFCIVFVVNEEDQEVVIYFLRENRRV